MVDVFISYQRDEREAVRIIAEKLTELKLDVWFDSNLRSGENFDQEIAQTLERAKAVLSCWSPRAISSEWVRAEATMARERGKLLACFLEPTELIPPFNLSHAEDLSAWAGQEFDTGWLKILERIGEIVDRPGLSTYYAVMRPGAGVQELRAWAHANGSDPLVGIVWERIEQLEGENANQRITREKAEARERDKKRKAQSARSRRLAKARGLRNPKLERRRWLALSAVVVFFALLITGWIGYTVDLDRRKQILDGATTAEDLREFIAANSWHPIAGTAQKRLERLDDAAWIDARIDGSIDAVNQYISSFQAGPYRHRNDAADALKKANEILDVQEKLLRLGLYKGPANGALNAETREAVKLFRARTGLVVSSNVDKELQETINRNIEVWISPQPKDLTAEDIDPPSEAELVDLANRLQVDMPTLLAVQEIESGTKGGFRFHQDKEARPIITFEPHIFSRLTGHLFDESHPRISSRRRDSKLIPRSQADRWKQLDMAFSLDPDSAYKATVIGRFQVMGLNAERLGYESVGEYMRNMSQSEAKQFEALFLFASRSKLIEHLQNRDWKAFARRYNGPGVADKYAERLQAAYDKYAGIYSRRQPWKDPIAPVQNQDK